MAQQQQNKAKRYFNFGVGWLNEQYGTLNIVVDHIKNKGANKGQGYKLFLVPVGDDGQPTDEGIEINSFRVKQTERTAKTPEKAPDYQVYAAQDLD